VPFATSTGSDGLAVYRSHFTQSGVACPVGSTCNGSASASNSLDGGNSLGGGSEAGGDVGGLIIGWDYGVVNTQNFGILGKVTKTGGRNVAFSSGTPANLSALVGKTITINGTNYEVAAVQSASVLYTLTNTGNQTGVPYSVYIPPAPTGVLGRKQ
jgi:hypothetical protein